MYELVRGPLVWVSILVFILGTILQVIRFYRMSQKLGPPKFNLPPMKKSESKGWSVQEWVKRLKLSVLGIRPVTIIISTVFHFCLFITPVFLLGHNELLDLSIGFGFYSLPEAVTDFLTVIFLMCAAFFLLRRIFSRRVRAITTFYDYVVLFLAIMPFLTGFLAYHHIFDYRTVMILHMLFGEVMLMAIPFTKLIHMIFFFLNRFLIVNQHTLGKGSRVYTY